MWSALRDRPREHRPGGPAITISRPTNRPRADAETAHLIDAHRDDRGLSALAQGTAADSPQSSPRHAVGRSWDELDRRWAGWGLLLSGGTVCPASRRARLARKAPAVARPCHEWVGEGWSPVVETGERAADREAVDGRVGAGSPVAGGHAPAAARWSLNRRPQPYYR